jgi:5-methylcytosine-specific restriction endonuclease McrA
MARINETGNCYNGIEVLQFSGVKTGKAMWTCRCHCGKEFVTRANNLRNGNTKSCGCSKIGMSPTEAPFRALWRDHKRRAQKFNRAWKISDKCFRKLIQQPCYYCKAMPYHSQKGKRGTLYYTGLDRVDPKEGYTLDNVVPCCRHCNQAKNNMTTCEFKEWIIDVYNGMFQ